MDAGRDHRGRRGPKRHRAGRSWRPQHSNPDQL